MAQARQVAPTIPKFTEPTPITRDNVGSSRRSLLIQGPSGGGKTHFACSSPQPIVFGYTDTNRAVPEEAIRSGADITLYPISTWREYEWFVLKTKNYEWEAETVVLDTYDRVADRLVVDIYNQPAAQTDDGNLKRSRWNEVLSAQWDQLQSFLQATKPGSRGNGYHLIVTIHEKDKWQGKGDAARVVAVEPDVPGGLREDFGGFFDHVFLCLEEPVYETGDSGVRKLTGSRHVLHTVAPDTLRKTKGGRGLPPQLTNEWPELVKHWEPST